MQKIKLVVLIAIIMFLSTTTPVSADNQAELAVETKVRVNVDGQLYQLTGYDFEGEYYFKRADMSQILPTINISDVRSFTLKESTYFSMRDIARNTNIAYEYDGVLTSCYIWTGEEYTDMGYGDFERAIATGLVDANVRDRTDEQITANEFRSILRKAINLLAPEKLDWFDSNMTDYNKPLLRGEGFVMAYYAAVCVGADTLNNMFEHTRADGGDFWDDGKYEMELLLPTARNGPVFFSNRDNEWNDYYTAGMLWSFWHSSPVSQIQVFEFDEVEGSMRQHQALTVIEAVCAAQRIFDSFDTDLAFVPVSDARVLSCDKSIITDELLNRAKTRQTYTDENFPVLNGFVLKTHTYDARNIIETEADMRNIANWGFNSARLMITYQTLFNDDISTADLHELKKMDSLVAAAMKHNLHLNIVTFSMPGRWTNIDMNTFVTEGSFDLFVNQDRQREANRLWAVLAERYKDVPNWALSFSPLWETQNFNLSSGLPYPEYNAQDVADVYDMLTDTIKQYNPNRFVIYEPTPNGSSDAIINESKVIKNQMESKYTNIKMLTNFGEAAYNYAEMTGESGSNIDYMNHSMFKPEYPVIIYAAQSNIENGEPLIMRGELVNGTRIDIYLEQTGSEGDFEIKADGNVLYSEHLTDGYYSLEPRLSGHYPYAKSDKLISVTLTSNINKLELSYSGQCTWSGIDVVLPEKYAVQRWWYTSDYDAFLQGLDNRPRPELRDTSIVMISPNSYGTGREIVINSDISYTSESVWKQANSETIKETARIVSTFAPGSVVRFEDACFTLGTTVESATRYYDDILTAFNIYGLSWYSNDYYNMILGGIGYANANPVNYKGHLLEKETLKLFQKHTDVQEISSPPEIVEQYDSRTTGK